MSDLDYTNGTLSTTFDSTEVDANFADVRTTVNGNLTTGNMSASAGITVGQLANSYQEVWLTLRFSAVTFGAWPAAPADPTAPTFTELIDYVPLPGSDADTAWVATDVSWVCNDSGNVVGSFDVRYGAYDGAGVMAGAGSITTGDTITAVDADKGSQGRALEGGSVTLTQSSTVRGIYLVSAGQGTNVMDDTAAPGSWLTVTVALRRQIQA
jgi:hypothetical protein